MSIYQVAAGFYNGVLLSNEGKAARKYLYNRGLAADTVNKFRLGTSAKTTDLYYYLSKRGFTPEEKERSHLFVDKYRDKFYGSITIPIIRNNVVESFTSRKLNSKEKPHHIHLNGGFSCPYNANVINKTDLLFIVESPMDAMILYQEGYDAIAVYGTASFKNEYLRFFTSYKGKIVWLFDNDHNLSGQNGMLKNACKLISVIKKDSFIGSIPLYYPESKIDVNILYLINKSKFRENISEIVKRSILYSTTEHYANFLKSQEVIDNKKIVSGKNRSLLVAIKQTPAKDIISRYIPLAPSSFGAMGLCPFHNDTDKSFAVYNNNNLFKCFGCGKTGDAVQFVMDHFKLTFIKAVKKIQEDFNYG